MKQIYIIEGADGTGKTSLARKISARTGGHMLHGSYSPEWNMKNYHQTMINTAAKLAIYQTVVLDRWAISEQIYGNVFREKPSYDVNEILEENKELLKDAIWIYCRNDDVVENHKINKTKREEMYETMEFVQEEYDIYIKQDKERDWKEYDYQKISIQAFINKLLEGEL